MLSFQAIPTTPFVVKEADPTAIPSGTIVAKFTDTTGQFYTGTIDWGDGNFDPFALAFEEAGNPGVYDVMTLTGHTYYEENTITPFFSIQAGMTNASNPSDQGITTNTATVLDAPLSGGGVNVTATEGIAPSSPGFLVATFTDPDTGPPGGPNPNSVNDYSASIDWGDGSPTSQGTIVSNGGGSYSVFGIHAYAEETAAGRPNTMKVTIVDTDGENPPQGTRSTLTFNPTATVVDASISLGAPSSPPTTFVEGRGSAGIVGTLTDSNPNPLPNDFTTAPGFVSINWGDATPTSQGFLQPLGNGHFNIFGVHTFAEEGTYLVTLNAEDEGGATALPVTYRLTVGDATISGSALPITGTEGGSAGGTVATFVDQNPNAPQSDFSGTINWGDGTGLQPFTSANVSLVSRTTSSSTWNVNLTHTYAEEGVFSPVTITVNDVGTSSTGPMTTSASIADAPLTATTTQPTISLVEGKTVAAPGFAVATFTDADPNGNPAVDYAASINWGDGSAVDTTSATFTKSGGVITVMANHSYLEEGSYRAVVTITDTDGPNGATTVPRSSVAIANTVTVADAQLTAPTAPPINAVEGIPLNFSSPAGAPPVLATFTDTDPNELETGDNPNAEYSVVINWGDGTPLDHTATVQQTGKAGTPYKIVGSTHIFADESGPFFGTITVTDVGGAFVNIPITTNVTEAPLIASTPPAPTITIGEGQTFNATTTNPVVRFVNSDMFEPSSELGYTLVSIDWGDGTPTSGGTIVADPNVPGAYDVLGSHAYAEEKLDVNGNPVPYTISATVTETVHLGTPSLYSVVTNKAFVPDSPITVTPTTFHGVEGIGLTPSPTTVATFTDGDLLNTDPGDYTISIDWGDGSPTSAGTAVQTGPGNWVVQGAHTYAEEGLYTQNPFPTPHGGVTVTVIDTDHGPANALGRAQQSAVSTAVISDAPLNPIGLNNPPITQDSSGATITEGKKLPPNTTITVGNFTDANPVVDLTDFSATIAWGDGSITQGTIKNSGGIYAVSGAHTYAEDGSYNVQVFIGDQGGSTTVINSTLVVADAPLSNSPAGTAANPLQSQEGALYSGPIATITDADPNGGQPSPLGHNDYAVSINWGDGSPTTSGILTGVGTMTLSGNHQYAEDGIFNITYTVWDTDGGPTTGRVSTTGTAVIAVQDAPLVNQTLTQVLSDPVKIVEGTPTTNTVATFTDLDPGAQQGDYTATIDWGDGTPTSSGTITPKAGTSNPIVWQVTGTHTYAEETPWGGTPYSVKVTITDDDHHLASTPAVPRSTLTVTNTSISVADAPLTANYVQIGGATEGSPVTWQWGFSDADTGNTKASDYVVTISWGDGSVSTATVAPDTIFPGPGNWMASASHTYAEEGTYAVTYQATDTDGITGVAFGRATTSASSVITVNDAALVDKTPVQTLAAVEGASANLAVALFSDNDPGGSPNATPADYTATINWGDGTPVVAGTVSTTGTAGVFQVTGTHTYAEDTTTPGRTPYHVTVQIWDTDGGPTTGRVNIVTSNTSVKVSDAALSISTAPFNIVGSSEGTPSTGVPLVVFRDNNPGAPIADFLPVGSGGEGGSIVVNWGDATPPQTLPASSIQSLGSGTFLVRGTHTYTEDGVYSVSITVNDAGGSSVSTAAPDHITVPDAPLSDAHNPQVIASANGVVINQVLGSVHDADPGAQLGDYTATINWGDGSPLDTTSAVFQPGLAAGTFNVLGSHNYTTTGVFAVTVFVTETDQHLGATPPVSRSTGTLTGSIITVSSTLGGPAPITVIGAPTVASPGGAPAPAPANGAVTDAALTAVTSDNVVVPSGIIGLPLVKDDGSMPLKVRKKL